MATDRDSSYKARFSGSRHYIDAQGPVLRDSFVAFVDLLGSREHIKQLDNTLLRSLVSALEYIGPVLSSFDLPGPDVALLGFTDNFVIATPVDEAYDAGGGQTRLQMLIANVAHFQFFMMMEGVALRGGIVRGPVFLADHFGTGQAILDGYLLESTAAVVPRVILSDEIVAQCRMTLAKEMARLRAYARIRRLFRLTRTGAEDYVPALARLVALDHTDGRAFVSYLFGREPGERSWADAERHKQVISERLTITDPRVQQKYTWLAQYHNFVFSHVPDMQIQGVLPGEGFEWLDTL